MLLVVSLLLKDISFQGSLLLQDRVAEVENETVSRNHRERPDEAFQGALLLQDEAAKGENTIWSKNHQERITEDKKYGPPFFLIL
jgi:hypothetical protein